MPRAQGKNTVAKGLLSWYNVGKLCEAGLITVRHKGEDCGFSGASEGELLRRKFPADYFTGEPPKIRIVPTRVALNAFYSSQRFNLSGKYSIIYIGFDMEFNEKLQELRKEKGLTQEELAASLYVSRAAISKWESGRGYPNIESLKGIAKFFSVTVDELLSTDEMLTIAEEDGKQKEKHFRDLTYGLLDILVVLFLFLPFFAEDADGIIQSVSLITLGGVQPYLKAAYLAAVIAITVMGVLTLALQNSQALVWVKGKTAASLALGIILVLLLMISSQPYACVFAFVLLAIKALMLIKRG